ncbi:MAG TPA: hypothetical protein PK472_01075, partial [Pseudomonadota bacterium]|nr:hypothetical protein [Pseudomonadota bacterium]
PAIAKAGLSDEEQASMAALFSDGDDGPASFDADPSVTQSAQLKLARAGLRAYAGAQKRLAGTAGDRFYQFDPDEDEWGEARRLAQKFGAQAVIFGHTHAARFRQDAELAYLNTGTWIRLLRLPAPDADDGEWADFLTLARKNPQLDPNKGPMVPIFTRFTAAVIEPAAQGGAQLSLVEWTPQGTLVTHAKGVVPAAQGAGK